MLHSAPRLDRRLVGAHHAQPDGPRRHVLVLLPVRPGRPHLVEGVGHEAADYPVHHRSRYGGPYPN